MATCTSHWRIVWVKLIILRKWQGHWGNHQKSHFVACSLFSCALGCPSAWQFYILNILQMCLTIRTFGTFQKATNLAISATLNKATLAMMKQTLRSPSMTNPSNIKSWVGHFIYSLPDSLLDNLDLVWGKNMPTQSTKGKNKALP